LLADGRVSKNRSDSVYDDAKVADERTENWAKSYTENDVEARTTVRLLRRFGGYREKARVSLYRRATSAGEARNREKEKEREREREGEREREREAQY